MPGQQGCGYDELADEVVELCDEERELAMGLEASTTAAPGISDGTRCALLGHAIEVNTLFMLVQAALCLHELGTVVNAPSQSKRQCARHVSEQPPAALRRLVVLLPANTLGEQVQQATRTAFEAGSDAWLDTELLTFLRHGPVAQAAVTRRVLARVAQGRALTSIIACIGSWLMHTWARLFTNKSVNPMHLPRSSLIAT